MKQDELKKEKEKERERKKYQHKRMKTAKVNTISIQAQLLNSNFTVCEKY